MENGNTLFTKMGTFLERFHAGEGRFSEGKTLFWWRNEGGGEKNAQVAHAEGISESQASSLI